MKLKFATISDIHLGHKRNDSDFIIGNLNKYVSCNENLSGLDMIFFVGDVFDHSIDLKSPAASSIVLWISRLIQHCSINNVAIRVLEGTPSHDCEQAKLFITLAESMKDNYPVDILYMDKLCIEKNDKFGVNILYVPDEWNHDNADTLQEVKDLLLENNLTQVDIAMMHGQFEYQIPMIAKPHIKHNQVEYEKLVKYVISIGHVHKQSHEGKVFAQGSTDRLSHNEEEDKGFYRFHINEDKVNSEFVINKTARIFKTFKFTMNIVDDIIEQLDKRLSNIPHNSFIRVLVYKDNPLFKNKDMLSRRYPTLTFTVDTLEKKESKKLNEVIENEKIYNPIIINRTTIGNLLRDRIILTDNGLVNDKIVSWIGRIPQLN